MLKMSHQYYLEKVFLTPGGVYVTQTPPAHVWMILGSCVSLVFFNERLKVGGISHAQLPQNGIQNHACTDACPVRCYSRAPDQNQLRYVSCSFHYLMDSFRQRGIHPDEIIVKLFGGSHILNTDFKDAVGPKNVQMALELIASHGLHVTAKDVGGKEGRVLHFFTDTGKVYLKRTSIHQSNYH